MRFEHKRAVVTGAAGDVGRLLCQQLCAEGADVLALDLDDERGAELEKSVSDGPGTLTYQHLDITDAEAVHAVCGAESSVDILINSAGVLSYSPIAETSVKEWDRVLAVNARGAFLTTQALGHALNEGSAIVNVSSVAAVKAEAGFAAYSASKAGLVALSKVAAIELAPRTRVNVVCPGPLDTQMPRKLLAGHPDADAVMVTMGEANLLKRLGTADEVVPLILLLASDDARLMTGTSVVIDAGMTA